MRTLAPCLAVATLALLGICAPAHAAKKKSIDFSEFKGNFTGTIVLTSTITNASGTASVSIKVPKSGRSATASLNGSLVVSNTAYPLFNTFSFAANKAFSQSQIIYGITPVAIPATGNYSGKKAPLFQGQVTVGSQTLVTRGSMTVKPQGKKRKKLTLTTVITDPAQPSLSLQFTTVAFAKVKPSKD